MEKWWIKFLYGICCLAFMPLGEARSFVYKVEKDGEFLFVGGTVHVLRKQDQLPAAYDMAYKSTDVLVTEVDLEELTSVGTAFKMTAMGFYQDGTTLDKVLSAEVFEEFKLFCEDNKFPLEPFLTMKPTMVSVNIVMSLMMREGARPEGIDMLFGKRALAENKKRLALETIDEQLSALFKSGANPNDIIRYTLKDASNIQPLLETMMKSILTGDAQTLEKELMEPMKAFSETYYESLIVNRNNQWVPKIEAMLKTPEKELVLVGALHLVGDVGVLQQLAARGYTITQLD